MCCCLLNVSTCVSVRCMYLPPPPLLPPSPPFIYVNTDTKQCTWEQSSNHCIRIKLYSSKTTATEVHMYICTSVIESKWVKSLHFITWVPLSPVIRSKSVETLGTSPPSSAVSRYAVGEGRGRRGSRYFAFCSQ